MCDLMTESMSYAMWSGGLISFIVLIVQFVLLERWNTGMWPWEFTKKAKFYGHTPMWWKVED